MNLCKILAVLLTLTLTVGCSTSASNEGITTGSYRLGKVLNVSGSSIRIKLADEQTDSFYNGRTFWVGVNKVSTIVNEDLSGTYVYVRGRKLGKRGVALSEVYEVRIAVRTNEQKEKWDKFLAEQRDLVYGPGDVYPPEVSR